MVSRKAIPIFGMAFLLVLRIMQMDLLYPVYKENPSIQTDTRKLQPGDLYFALKGPRFNGNLFAMQALEKGAAYVVVDEWQQGLPPSRTFLVEDVLDTLQQLALYHRQQLGIPVLAITGSNGKTTTKELIHAVLSTTYTTYTTVGNLNNHIGIPLTLLSIREDAQIAVIEMGANHQKEIEGYCRYALPTHGLITNVGKAHLEGFGGPEGVRKGKGELYDFLRAHEGTAFVMWDYDYLREMSRGIPHLVTYGSSEADIQGRVHQGEPFLEVDILQAEGMKTIHTQLVGSYNLPNVLAAVAVGRYFKIPDDKIGLAIESYVPSNSRSQLVEKNSNHIILDAYNANPSSMKAAIENFAALQAGQKILLLGAMAELGEDSLAEHESMVRLIARYPWTEVVLVGGDFMRIPHPFKRFATVTEAKAWLDQQDFRGSYWLIKGSRSMQMEKLLG